MNTQRIKRATVATIAALGITLLANQARASDLGLRLGYYFDADAVSVGMEMLTPINGMEGEWYFNPNLDIAMGDNRDLAALNFDFHYDFQTESNVAVWAGAGPALLIIDQDRFSNDTDVDPALDLLMGFGAKTGTYRPFVQGKGILSDNSEAAITVGVRF